MENLIRNCSISLWFVCGVCRGYLISYHIRPQRQIFEHENIVSKANAISKESEKVVKSCKYLKTMMKSTDSVRSEEEGALPTTAVKLNIWHKVKQYSYSPVINWRHCSQVQILFYLVGLTAALTICLLIRLSNKLAADAQRKAMAHFKEISNRIGHRFDN